MLKFQKYRWTKVLKALLITAGFAVYGGLNANHILGGEVSYTSLGGKKYKFTVKLYRNCNECEFNTGNCADVEYLDIYASPEELSYAKKLSSIPLTKIGRKDVTPLCKTEADSCQGGGFPLGIEEWTFEGTVDFDTVSIEYCRFEVAIRVDSRLDAYNTSSNDAFYNYARVNTCNNIRNNSPEFKSPVYYLLPQNQSYTYNILATDPDKDSLSYRLVKAQKGWNTVLNYPAAYGATRPFDIYCPSGNCTLDKTKWPVEGMGIEPVSGWMGFTPVTSGQTGFLVTEITEWRRVNGIWTAIGVSRRDMQIQVVDVDNHVPKLSTSSFEYYACAGDSFLIDFNINDPVFGLTKDSVSLYFSSELSGGKLTKVVASAKNQFDAFFKLPTLGLNLIRKKPYYVTFIAIDDHCPLLGATYKTIAIEVTGLPKSQSTVAFKECNKIECTTVATGSEYTHAWFLFDGSVFLETKNGTSAVFEVPKPGYYIIRHQVSNSVTGCNLNLSDTILVPFFSLMKPALTWPQKVCKNEPFTVKAGFTGGTPVFVYWWNNTLGTDALNLQLNKDTLIKLQVRDANGCYLSASQTIKLFPTMNVIASDTSMCLPANGASVTLNNRISITPTKVQKNFNFQFLGSLSEGVMTRNGDWHYFQPLKSVHNHFNFDYTDENSCHYKTSFIIKVVDPIPTGIVTPASLCSNDAPIVLNTATKCILSDGIWKSDASSSAVKDGIFHASISGSGMFDLIYSKDLAGCILRDTTSILVNQAPTVSISKPSDLQYCSTDANTTLSAQPGSGIWSNNVNAPAPNLFSPSDVVAKGFREARFEYLYTDPVNKCVAKDWVTFMVNPAPKLSLLADYSICSGARLLLDPKVENATKLNLTGDFQDLDVQRIDDNFMLTANSVSQKSSYKLSMVIRALPGCEDISRDFQLTIKPLPELAIDPFPSKGCVPLSTLLQVKNLNSKAIATEYYWAEGSNWISGANYRSMLIANSGDYNYQVTGVLEGCSSAIAGTSVSVFSVPQALIETNPKNGIISADFTNITFQDASISSVPYTVFWEFQRGTPPVSDKSRVSVDFPKDTGLYRIKLTVTSDEGCKSSEISYIRVRPGLQFFVPNAFTPNRKGPDENEVFRVVMDSAVNYSLTLRNRWGQILFSSNNQNQAWDGTYMNQLAPDGVYVWELEATTMYGIYVLRKGTVTLIR